MQDKSRSGPKMGPLGNPNNKHHYCTLRQIVLGKLGNCDKEVMACYELAYKVHCYFVSTYMVQIMKVYNNIIGVFNCCTYTNLKVKTCKSLINL